MSTRLYPVYLDLQDRDVLVVGGGRVAARKVAVLLNSGADITVLAPSVSNELEELSAKNQISLHTRPYRTEDMSDKWLVIAATDDPDVNHQVSLDAAEAGVFCNVVDDPELCSFQVPAVVRRGLLQIAISTGGASPGLAKRLRRQLETEFGPAYEKLLDGLMELRQHVQSKYPERPKTRRRILEDFLDSPAPARLIQDENAQGFRRILDEWKDE